MSCNTSIDYKTYLFHKEKIINFVYEENSQVVFREKFNQMLQKIKNEKSRHWIKEKLFDIIGTKSYVYDKLSIIEALNSIEQNCYGRVAKDNTLLQEDDDDETDIEEDDNDETDIAEEDEGDEEDENDEKEIEGFKYGIFDKLVEGFVSKKKRKKMRKGLKKQVKKRVPKSVRKSVGKSIPGLKSKKKAKKKKKDKKKQQAEERQRMYNAWKDQCYEHYDGGKKKIINKTLSGVRKSCSQIEGELSEFDTYKQNFCKHCKTKSGYFLSGNKYVDDSRNVSGTGDDMYICNKCNIPNDYLMEPIAKISAFHAFLEVVLHICAFLAILLYTILFTNLSFESKIEKNESKIEKSKPNESSSSTCATHNSNTEFTSTNPIMRMILFIISATMKSLLCTQDNNQITTVLSMIPIFAIISFAFIFGFYSGDLNHAAGHLNAFISLIFLILYRTFLIAFRSTFTYGPKIIPLIHSLRSWNWLFLGIMIVFGIYVLFVPLSEIQYGESNGLEGFVSMINNFLFSFANALGAPLLSILKSIKKTGESYTAFITGFFEILILSILCFIPSIFFYAIMASIFFCYSIINTVYSIMDLFKDKQIFQYLIMTVLILAVKYAIIWYFLSIEKFHKPGMSKLTLSALQGIFTLVVPISFLLFYLYKFVYKAS